MQNNSFVNEDLLNRIVNHLILNSNYIIDNGLYHGKMGIVIFFYHYSRYVQNSIYEDFAGELLDEIYQELNEDLPVNFERGYCGIGWAIEYLVQKKFVQGNTNEILYDLDRKVIERDLRKINDSSFKKGVGGILYYVYCRLLNNSNKDNSILFDKQYFLELLMHNNILFIDGVDICEKISTYYNYSNIQNQSEIKLSDINLNIINNLLIDIPTSNLGLDNGLSGYGIKLMQL